MKIALQVKTLERVAVYSAACAIVTLGLSISLSQFAMGLSFIFYLSYLCFCYINQRPVHLESLDVFSSSLFVRLKNGYQSFPKPFRAGILLYTVIICTSLIHILRDVQPLAALERAVTSDWSDISLLFFALLVWKLAIHKENLHIFIRAVIISIALVLFTGLIAVFSEAQLSSILPGKPLRFQQPMPITYWHITKQKIPDFLHVFLDCGKKMCDIRLHRTQGLMGNLLSYTGLLILMLPLVFYATLRFTLIRKKYTVTLLLFLGFCCAVSLIWLNGSRSVVLGFICALPFLLYFLSRDILGIKGSKFFFRCVFPIGLLLVASLGILFATDFFVSKKISKYSPYTRTMNPRSVIWTESGEIIHKNFLLGVGSGNYARAIQQQREVYNRQVPFDIQLEKIFPLAKGHAHNDLLYMLAIAGLVGGFFYLYLLHSVITFALQNKSRWGPYFLWSCIVLLFASLTQCYFIDDEVAVLFWLWIALSARLPYDNCKGELQKKNQLLGQQRKGKLIEVFTNKSKNILPRLGLASISIYSILEIVEKTYTILYTIAIVSMALSITVSQTCAFLSLFLWLMHCLVRRRFSLDANSSHDDFKQREKIPLLFVLGFCLAAAMAISGLYHSFWPSFIDKQALLTAFNPEIFLLLFAFMLWSLSKEQRHLKAMHLGLFLFMTLLIASGFFSLFSDVRLSALVMDKQIIAADGSLRYQQSYLFDIFGVSIYSPQGFTSHRLTYAGLVILILPYVFYQTLQTLLSKKRLSHFLFYVLFSIIGLVILWCNGVRSAMIGFILAMLALLWGLQYNFPWRSFFIKRKKLTFSCITMVFLLASFSIWLIVSYDLHTSLFRPFLRLSDFGRALMWTESGDIIWENPIFGVGVSNYEQVSNTWRDLFLVNNPDTWYSMHFVPRSHVHNDLLDLVYNYGIFTGLIFIAFLFCILKFVLSLSQSQKKLAIFLFAGCLALVFASFAQCYFKDDEVLVVFWLLIALGLREAKQ